MAEVKQIPPAGEPATNGTGLRPKSAGQEETEPRSAPAYQPRYAHMGGWGYHLPSKGITNHGREQIVDTNDGWIRSRAGIAFGKAREIAASYPIDRSFWRWDRGYYDYYGSALRDGAGLTAGAAGASGVRIIQGIGSRPRPRSWTTRPLLSPPGRKPGKKKHHNMCRVPLTDVALSGRLLCRGYQRATGRGVGWRGAGRGAIAWAAGVARGAGEPRKGGAHHRDHRRADAIQERLGGPPGADPSRYKEAVAGLTQAPIRGPVPE